MTIAETSFAEAAKRFTAFLRESGLPGELLWVFKEDVFSRRVEHFETRFWIKLPLPGENKTLAEKHYEAGRQKGLGAGLAAFAVCGDKVCCSVVVPEDREDAELLLMSPTCVKLSFVLQMPAAIPIRSALRWNLFRLMPFR